MKIYYYSYGSNMNQNRMLERGCIFDKVEKAKLKNYILVFNKKSQKDPSITFANVIQKENSIVEGMLYTLDEDKIKLLDKFEGFPKHYNRILLDVETDNGLVNAYVYIAQQEWISNGLPSKEYLNHLLEGKNFLSENYYNMLKETVTK